MFEERERLSVIATRDGNARTRHGEDRPIKGVLGFRQQLERAVAFADRFSTPPEAGVSQTEEGAARTIVRAFAHRPLGLKTRILEARPRLFAIVRQRVNRSEQIRLEIGALVSPRDFITGLRSKTLISSG